MRDEYQAFRAAGAEIIVITRHDQQEMKKFWEKKKLPFVGVSDAEGKITSRFSQQWKLFSLGRMPAQFVLDCQGKIALSHYGKSMSDILPNDAVLRAVRATKARPGCPTPSSP